SPQIADRLAIKRASNNPNRLRLSLDQEPAPLEQGRGLIGQQQLSSARTRLKAANFRLKAFTPDAKARRTFRRCG
ncbi:hypothetical protein, partial [Mesorhizobium sp. M5C.F.Ca.IN.020.32.2.1]|uniref:hypothetical protein n=1 Tax=Mesorhizobium sp. M5C.F.Ca.IN.020.32.2.1 TaxID=2496771 RepID=UPI0019D479CE